MSKGSSETNGIKTLLRFQSANTSVFLLAVSIVLFIRFIKLFKMDLFYSALPLMTWGIVADLAWAISWLTTASEVLWTFFESHLRQAFDQNVPEVNLPNISPRYKTILTWVNRGAMIVDVVTNFFGGIIEYNRWVANGQPIPLIGYVATKPNIFIKFGSIIVITLFLTFSEFFMIFALSLALTQCVNLWNVLKVKNLFLKRQSRRNNHDNDEPQEEEPQMQM